jgi:hypothetical protein
MRESIQGAQPSIQGSLNKLDTFGATTNTTTSTLQVFQGPYGNGDFATTETNKGIQLLRNWTIKRHAIRVHTNSRTAAIPLAIRRNGVDVGTPLSITAATLGLFTQLEDILFTPSDKFNWRMDLTGSTGTLGFLMWVEYESG